MAFLMSVRKLSIQDIPPPNVVFRPYSSSMAPGSAMNGKRTESSATLVRAPEEESDQGIKETSICEVDEVSGAFTNPTFQQDALDDQDEGHQEGLTFVEIDNDYKLHNDSGLPPSDSGIYIGDMNCNNNNEGDVTSVVSVKSLDSGLDEYSNPKSPHNPKQVPLKSESQKPPKDCSYPDKSDVPSEDDQESLLAIFVQVFIPFLIAGIGTCGAGIVLDTVEQWEVFKNVTELYVLVPTLLGLKGNLEMTLASRVSTQVNLGKLPTWVDRWTMCWGNMALVQCQATVMAFLASGFATGMQAASSKGFDLERALLLVASSLFTASVASLVLGALTLAVVLFSHKLHINPDNVATPLAASLGDVTTLGILAAIASYLRSMQGDLIPPSVCAAGFLLLIPGWTYASYRNNYVKQVLFTGWVPVIAAVVITSAGGHILEFSVSKFKGFAIFQPVINGVAGNLVAVQASRISTYFHAYSKPGSKPLDGTGLCASPYAAFFGKTPHARTAKILLAMVIPGHILFGYGITGIKGGDTVLTPTFLPIYLMTALIQVMILLYIAQCMIQILWRFRIDPDNSAIPLLTALGDLSGMAALTAAFFLHRAIIADDTPISTLPPIDFTNSTSTIT